jgi:hypothetical protein
MATGSFSAIKRQYLFALLFGPSVLLMVLLKRFGVASDVATGLMFLPALAIFIWNRVQGVDRLQGLAAPTLALSGSISLGGFTQYKDGAVFEWLHLVGLIGAILSIGWLFWFLLFPGGRAKQR